MKIALTNVVIPSLSRKMVEFMAYSKTTGDLDRWCFHRRIELATVLAIIIVRETPTTCEYLKL